MQFTITPKILAKLEAQLNAVGFTEKAKNDNAQDLIINGHSVIVEAVYVNPVLTVTLLHKSFPADLESDASVESQIQQAIQSAINSCTL
jgi:cephalosporin hydroxylase